MKTNEALELAKASLTNEEQARRAAVEVAQSAGVKVTDFLRAVLFVRAAGDDLRALVALTEDGDVEK